MLSGSRRAAALTGLLAASLFVAGYGSGALAQQGSGPQQNGAATEENGYVCLARSGTGPGGSAQTTKIMVPASYESILQGRGFNRTNCADAKKWLQAAGPSMCALADVDDPAFVSQFLNTNGLTPQEVCQLLGLLPGGS
ncbi:hypothetical protein [uncultured Erythrobacter sp.]|uniref:hypothetical protein n=1 Tax=uncultured Erythrobacter sp. TaxID=263913 RepID=UPI00261F328C|nr:hypothetical protein [uncultured Erythrobacter sp.]